MKSTWIIVADNTNARIFTAESSKSELEEIETLCHLEGRMHDREMTTDLPGKIKSAGGGGHAFEQATDPKKHDADVFASRVAKHLDEACNGNKFGQLLIVAEPSFLGLLRQHLSGQVKKHVRFELDKNITHQSPADIRQHLPEYLPSS